MSGPYDQDALGGERASAAPAGTNGTHTEPGLAEALPDAGGERPDGDERSEEGDVEQEGRSLAAAIEAVLIVATEPVPSRLLAELLEVSIERAEALLSALAASYRDEQRGFELVEIAGGYRLQSHPAYRGYVERFILDDAPHRLSPAALETLAIVAYKQPISRAQVAAIRGVNADGVMRLLSQRGYIAEVGRDEGPGQAVLFGTTSLFLERLGLAHLGQLPALQEFVPDAETVELLEQVLRTGPAASVSEEPAGEAEAAGPTPEP